MTAKFYLEHAKARRLEAVKYLAAKKRADASKAVIFNNASQCTIVWEAA